MASVDATSVNPESASGRSVHGSKSDGETDR